MKITEITPQIAAFYLGHKWTLKTGKPQDATLVAVVQAENQKPLVFNYGDIEISLEPEHCTPHLRRIESLTEDEARELYEISHGAKFPKNGNALIWWNNPVTLDCSNRESEIGSPAVWLKLLEWGIDLFGLIDSGLAKEIKS